MIFTMPLKVIKVLMYGKKQKTKQAPTERLDRRFLDPRRNMMLAGR